MPPYLILRLWSRRATLTAYAEARMQRRTKTNWMIQYAAPHFLIPMIESIYLDPMHRFIRIRATSNKTQMAYFIH